MGNRNSDGTFRLGSSGNPTGKKKGTISVPDMFKRILKEPFTDDYNKYESILRSVVDEALNGTRWAIELILDRTDGKPYQAIYTSPNDVPNGFEVCEYTEEELSGQDKVLDKGKSGGEILGAWGND